MIDINNLERIKEAFYLQKTEKVAKDLIGKLFVRTLDNNSIIAAEITETEAYLSAGDLASHSAKRKSVRNAPMFESGGILYVYFIYGNHFCSNIVTEKSGTGSAVLIRAARPVEGLELMANNRGVEKIENLCKGPGNFAKAFNIDRNDNYEKLYSKKISKFSIYQFNNYTDNEIIQTTRIGIKQSSELLLRFYLKDSNFISKK